MKRQTDLHEVDLQGCLECAPLDRTRNTTAMGFCKVIKGSDGLDVKCVGSWGREKVFTVSQYVGIVADAMVGKYDHLNYLEICCGPGRCVTRNGVEIDGTAMSLLRHWTIDKWSSAVFVDIDRQAIDVLNQRIANLDVSIPAFACVGDYNDLSTIDAAISHLNLQGRTLTLCVLDPYDCSMPFSVIEHIKNRVGNCDFIISYFDGLDAKRNFPTAIRDNKESELLRFAAFLGMTPREMDEFVHSQEVADALIRPTTSDLMALFNQCYRENLKKIGLEYYADRPVRKGIDMGVEFYKLLFASAHPKGLEFWKKIGTVSSTGQRLFDFT